MSVTWLCLSGASRSGTTFLNVLLNTHPRIALFTESGIDRIVLEIHRCFSVGRIVADSRGADTPISPTRNDIDLFAKVLFELRFKKEKLSIVGDKMPNINSNIFATYSKHVPDLKNICIVRKPSDTIASSLERRDFTRIGADSWHVGSVEDAIVEWALNWEYAAAAANALIVAYERFEHDMTSELIRIADFLEVDYNKFSKDVFKKDCKNKYTLSESESAAIDNILGPVERCLPHDMEQALAAMPRIYPKIRLGAAVRTNKNSPCALLFFKEGFSLLEDWGVWTDGHDALMGFRVDCGIEKVRVSLHLTAFAGNRPYFDLLVKPKNQIEYRATRIQNSTNRTTVSVDCVPRHDGVVELCLRMPLVKSEEEEPTYDPRGLGIGLFYIVVNPIFHG